MSDMEGAGEARPASMMSTVMKELSSLKEKFKNEDDEYGPISPFDGIEKSAVLQEAAAVFNDPTAVKKRPRVCCQVITKLLYLLAQGESFEGNDATDVFFAVTKLFQSQDLNLRRMTYLFIKEVAESTDAQEIIIVTASLTKDMNSNEELYRGNSIRVLCKIIDAAMLGQIERYIKQAVVDRNSLISSSALLSANQMVNDSAKRDVVRRWVNEVQESVNGRSEMVQYHALSLLYNLKSHDKLAINKLVTQLAKSPPRSPLAMCLLVRYTARLLHQDISASDARHAYEFLENCLRHKNEMVIYEAARAICRLPGVAPRDIAPAITVLQLFLCSPKPSLRFAAVRTLNEVAIKHPMSVTKCNEDMESLISDSNRSIATLAITTLLKTGTESGVERLMKQISNFMGEIPDEFKVVVVHAIRALCLKYPSKNRVLLNFMSSILREEGGFEFKKAIVDTILHLIDAIPETRESGLFHLCEFIEDCEFTQLSAEVIHLLGELGPKTRNPAKFIRYIYNRIILENAHVRAAAVSSLGSIGAQVPSLKESVCAILERCQGDEDDEVRDRATACLTLLASGDAPSILLGNVPQGFEVLGKQVEIYMQRPSPGPMTFDTLPVIEVHEATDTEKKRMKRDASPGFSDPFDADDGMEDDDAAAAAGSTEELYAVPEFSNLGPVFRSCMPVELTESETEYLVRCTKHIFNEHIVFEFKLTNTLNDQLLKDVSVGMEEQESEMLELVHSVGCPKLPYDTTKSAFVCYRFDPDDEEGLPTGALFTCELKFNIKDCDPETGEEDDPDDEGYEEQYPLEDVEIAGSDFIAKVPVGEFRMSWEKIGKSAEVLDKFQLSQYDEVAPAVQATIDCLGMKPVNGTDAVPPNCRSHNVLLSGVFLGGIKVLARFQVALGNEGAILKIAIRSSDMNVSEAVVDCIR